MVSLKLPHLGFPPWVHVDANLDPFIWTTKDIEGYFSLYVAEDALRLTKLLRFLLSEGNINCMVTFIAYKLTIKKTDTAEDMLHGCPLFSPLLYLDDAHLSMASDKTSPNGKSFIPFT